MNFKKLAADEIIKELDLVLEFMVIHPESNNITYADLSTKLKPRITDENLLIYLEKLVKDGFIYYDKENDKVNIRLEGAIMYLDDGYTHKRITDKEKEAADLSLKKISKGSISFNKYFPLLAVLVALSALVIPLKFGKSKTFKIDEEQLQLLQRYQDTNKQLIQQIHLDLISLDSLSKK